MEAAKSVRNEHHHTTDVRSLFLKHGAKHVDEMPFEAEMLVPGWVKMISADCDGSITFLR